MGVYLHRNNKRDAGNVGRAPAVCSMVLIALIYIRRHLKVHVLRVNTLLKVTYLLGGSVGIQTQTDLTLRFMLILLY